MRGVVAVIAARPRVDVDDSVRRNHQVAGMSDAVGEYARAKAGRQFQPAVIGRTCGAVELCTGGMDWADAAELPAHQAPSTASSDPKVLCRPEKSMSHPPINVD